MKLVFLGPPGSGKGTYASRMEKKFGWPQISTGDLCRKAVKNKTNYAEEISRYMQEGKLVPLEIVIKLLKQRISREDCKEGFILDGFPRSLEQARELENITDIDIVVNLLVPEQVVIDRLSTRRVCRNCGEIYNIKSVKPKVDGKCDKCGGELYQRKDDMPEVIQKRLVVYQEQTAPLIKYYKEKTILKDVECNQADVPPEVMVNKIIETLGL